MSYYVILGVNADDTFTARMFLGADNNNPDSTVDETFDTPAPISPDEQMAEIIDARITELGG